MRKWFIVSLALYIYGASVVSAAPAVARAGAAAASVGAGKKDPGPLTFTFTDTVPTTITLGASYDGPANPSLAEYDAGNGVWQTYTSKTITMQGQYVAFRGDWRRAANGYFAIFSGTFASDDCVVSGRFEYDVNGISSGYREVFSECSSILQYVDNPFQPLSGAPAASMFYQTFSDNSSVTSYPTHDGFMDTSNISGAPAIYMFRRTFSGNSSVTSYPTHDGFMDTSGISGAPAIGMFWRTFSGNSSVTSYPTHDGFMDTSNISGAPAGRMFYQTFYNNSAVTNAFVFKLGAGITFDADNLGTLNQTFSACTKWTGTVMWGNQKIYEAIPTPSARNQCFDGCTSMPDYDTLHANWK